MVNLALREEKWAFKVLKSKQIEKKLYVLLADNSKRYVSKRYFKKW